MNQPTPYREQSNGEIHLVTADPNLHCQLMNRVKDRNFFVQALHPDGPTEPTFRRNRENIKAVLVDKCVLDDSRDIAVRVLSEAHEIGLLSAVLIPEESVREQVSCLLGEQHASGAMVVLLSDI